MIISEVHFGPLPFLLGLCNLAWLRRPHRAEKLQGRERSSGTGPRKRDLRGCHSIQPRAFEQQQAEGTCGAVKWFAHSDARRGGRSAPGSGRNLGNITADGQTRSCLRDLQVSKKRQQRSVLSVDAGSTGGRSGIGG